MPPSAPFRCPLAGAAAAPRLWRVSRARRTKCGNPQRGLTLHTPCAAVRGPLGPRGWTPRPHRPSADGRASRGALRVAALRSARGALPPRNYRPPGGGLQPGNFALRATWPLDGARPSGIVQADSFWLPPPLRPTAQRGRGLDALAPEYPFGILRLPLAFSIGTGFRGCIHGNPSPRHKSCFLHEGHSWPPQPPPDPNSRTPAPVPPTNVT